MYTTLMGAPRLANVLLVLLIANFSVALSPATEDRALLRSSSNFAAADPSIRQNLADQPARWRLISPSEVQPQEIEIPLLKRHAQYDDWKGQNPSDTRSVETSKGMPLYRGIFNMPHRDCPRGQQMDANGDCRATVDL